MNNRHLILLTNTWPFDYGETFIDEEAIYLNELFDTIDVFPLFSTSGVMRKAPENFIIHDPALKKDSKCGSNLLKEGIFSTAPLFFALKWFFKEKAYKPSRIWNFFTSLLIFRASYPTLHRFNISENDLVYSYWGDKWAVSLPFIKTETKCKTLSRFHGTDLYEEAKQGYIPFRELLFNSLDMAAPISDSGKKYIADRYGCFFKGKLETFRLGVMHNTQNPIGDNGVFKILSCSNAVPVKRLELIAGCLSYIKSAVSWTHIGDGPTLNSVKDMVRNMPDNISVDFKGKIPNIDVRNLYAAEHFDLFINVSSSEGIPVSIMEALASGIPVMATNVGGTSEIVDETVGMLINKDITAAYLANKISSMIKSADWVSLRHNSVERWCQMYDSGKNYRLFADTIHQFLR